ncbi:MAG TPA: EAL domain-containing protein [Burkholderiales bacterium]|nr:EAL domain-containing protein [Burkholderiales bacterium]
MSEPNPIVALQGVAEAAASYAGRTRYTQLEYEALLANASIGIAFTRERRFFLCNPKFAEMFGYRPEELIGQPGEMVYASRESYEALGKVAVPVLSSGRQLDIEWEMRRRDGTPFLCRMIAKAIDAENRQQGTVWIVEDITERKRHADEVARLLREQEAILGTASIGIVFVKDRRIVRCNRRYEEMYGYGPGELDGKTASIIYPDLRAYADAANIYEPLAAGRTSRRIELRRRKDGTTFWNRADGRAVDPKDPHKGTVWIVEDITDQQRDAEALQRLLAEQEALLNNVVVGIQFTRERRTVRCNRRFEEMFGYAPGAAVGAPTRDVYFTDEEYEAVAREYAELDQGRTHARESRVRRQDGSGFWCRISGRAVQPGEPGKGYVWLLEDITERKRADEALARLAGEQQQAEDRIERALAEQELILDNASVGIAFVRGRVIQRCNRFLEEMVGAGPGELLAASSMVLFADPADWEKAGALAYLTTAPGGTHDSEWRFRRRDGTDFRCRTRGRRIDAGEEVQEWIWSFEDVTLEREAEVRVQRALAEQELILDNATVGIAFARNRIYQRCNPGFERMLGYAPGELVGASSEAIYAHPEEYAADAALYAEMQRGKAVSGERLLRRKDGTTFWCKLVGRAIDAANPLEGSIWIYDDIDAEHQARQSLEAARASLERAVAERTAELEEAKARAQHLADHDALTGLPNRRLLEDRLTQALALSQRNGKQTAVMFVDLDRFKPINDTLGHAVGDRLLKEISQRLVNQLRIGDTVCRIGGDEFIVVLPQLKRPADTAQVAQKVIDQLSQPVLVDERELIVSCSIGIAVFPDDGRDAETLIRNADAAMYHAKELGRANYQFFTEKMNVAAARRLSLESDLRRALARDELRVHYQPFVDAKSGRVAGHESLLRWQHAERGLVMPGDFVPLAEETGLILGIGEWVLRAACRWATFIGAASRGLQVAVNLSPRQFNDPKLAQMVAKALEETGLPPRLLELEITETLAMQHTDVTLSTLKRLKQLGVSIAIDDFGTGYSSLAYLKRFPVDKVKIDRTFVAEAPIDRDQAAIVSAIVALAHALQIEVIAEGVESEQQLDFLRRSGCDYLQGFLIGRPLDSDSAAKDYL